MTLWEEAEIFELGGISFYAWGLFCALGMAAMLLLLALLMRRRGMQKGAAALTGLLGMALGAVVSRVVYCALEQGLGAPFSLRMLLLFPGGGYSMLGALAGLALGARLSARLLKTPAGNVLDAALAAAPAFILFERLGERYVPDFGISRPLVGAFARALPIAIVGDYDAYLATYWLEAAVALVLLIILAADYCKSRRAGDTAILFCLLFGAAQVIMESLRYDRHLSISFVGLQQVMAMALAYWGVWLAYRHARSRRLGLAALVSLPLVVGLGVALEFAIDRTNINRYLLYALFIGLLSAPVYLGLRMRKES